MVLAWTAALVFMAAAGRDIGWRLIDNRLVAAPILLWAAFAVLSGWNWGLVLAHVGVAGLAFCVTLVFYHFGWMAGGDVKLATAVFIWAGPQNAAAAIVVVSVAGLAIAIIGISARLLLRLSLPVGVTKVLDLFSPDHGVPYGAALAVGGVVSALAVPAGAG
ncbi:MAG TPA: prepilin peptidase [Magnetospirillum sp.]|nr:prepilin peptidase [Magnetospirillum sp.]